MTQDRRRVAVLGAGANGASIGADLTDAGLDVLLIEQWPAHVERMRQVGAEIRMPERTQRSAVQVAHLCDVATLREPFDVVLMLVKAYDTRWAAHLVEPLLAPDGLLVGVQNGMTTDTIAEVVGPERTMGCVIEIASMMFEPGLVERLSPFERSWFAVGGIDPATRHRREEVASLLRLVGSVEVVDDIRATKWMKLVSNACTLALTAVLGTPLLEAADDPDVRALMLRCGAEAMAAGAAQGHPVLPIFGLGPDDVADRERVPEVLLDRLLDGFTLKGTKTTVLQDWMKGRRSEVHDINGRVVAELARAGGAAPANAAVVELASRIEAGDLDPDPGNLARLLDLAGR